MFRWSCYGYIPPAIEGFEVASENVEEDKNPTSDKENETEPQANAVLEKKYTPQEKTNAIQDKASNKYVIFMHKDLLHISVSLYLSVIYPPCMGCHVHKKIKKVYVNMGPWMFYLSVMTHFVLGGEG